MKRFAFLAIMCSCALWIGATAYPQSGGGGGGGGGGAGGAGGGGAGGTSGGGATGGATGGTGSGGVQAGTGSGGIQAGTGSRGITGPRTGTGARSNLGGVGGGNVPPGRQTVPIIPFGGAGQGAQGGQQGGQAIGGPRQTPWFSDPGVRQQMGLNESQFNQLNSGYRDAWNRYNQRAGGVNNGAIQNQQSQQTQQRSAQQNQQRARQNAQQNQQAQQRNLQQNIQRRQQTAQENQRNIATSRQGIDPQRGFSQQQLRQSFDDDFSRVVDQTFTDPAARQRYNELYLQYQGPGAFSNPAVAEQLNLNANQQTQFTRLSNDWNQALARLQTTYDTDPQTATQQYNALRQQANEQLTQLLSPQQLANWRRMSGSQYQFPASAYLRPSTQSLDPSGDRARARVNEQLEDQENDSIFDGDRVPGQGGTDLGTPGSRVPTSDIDIGTPRNDSAAQ